MFLVIFVDIFFLFSLILAYFCSFSFIFLPFRCQNVVAIVMLLVRWAIPDMSGKLRDKIRREAYITNEIIIRQEAERARRLADGANFYHFKISFCDF